MKIIRRAIAIGALAALNPSIGAPEENDDESIIFLNGNMAYELCTLNEKNAFSSLYAAGVADMYTFLKLSQTEVEDGDLVSIVRLCFPHGVTAAQLGDTFCRYLERNPGRRHEPAGILAILSFNENFRCNG